MSHPSEHALHLSVDQLAAHLDRRLRGTERESVVAHLVECAECRREYVATSEVVGAPRRTWGWARTGIGLAIAAAIVFAAVPRAFRRPGAATMREVSAERASIPDIAPPIQIATPTDGERLTGTDVRLAWHPHGKDALYHVTVQTADGAVIWKAETHDSSYTLPRSVQLASGATYYWIVDALHADGRTAHSPATGFIR